MNPKDPIVEYLNEYIDLCIERLEWKHFNDLAAKEQYIKNHISCYEQYRDIDTKISVTFGSAFSDGPSLLAFIYLNHHKDEYNIRGFSGGVTYTKI